MATLRDTKVHFLKLVEPSTGGESAAPIVVDTSTGEQRTLFASRGRRIVIFVNASTVADRDLRSVVEASTQGTVLDIRVAPRFDFGSLNRGKTFGLFEAFKVSYVDYCGLEGVRSPDDPKLEPAAIADRAKNARAGHQSGGNPLCILLDSHQLNDEFVAEFMDHFVDDQNSWDVLVVPQQWLIEAHPAEEPRQLIFLSHAAPEDNAFASWLATRLKVAGYEPWLDLGELRNGEPFWPAIESTLKDRTAVVLAITSNESRVKEGVLNEIHLATTLERVRKLKGFIVPIRLDGISAVDMPIQLQRRQYVDFSRGWAEGLRKLTSDLQTRRIVRQTTSASDFSAWVDRSLTLRSRIGADSEELVCNWLPISQLPFQVFLHEPPIGMAVGEFAREQGDADPLIVDGKWCTFAELASFREERAGLFRAPRTTRYLTADWCSDEAVTPPCGKRNVRRAQMIDLLRRSLERTMEQAHLKPFKLSGRRLAWFFEHGTLPNNKVIWVDAKGKSRRKNLVGFSPKKSVYWHLALELKPTLWPQPLVIVKMHVIFSANGRAPLGDATKMHALRRRFCKSWWNDNWRDLLLASLSELSRGGQNLFDSRCDGPQALCVRRAPLETIVPFSISAADAVEEDQSEDIEEQLADDEEWTLEDFEDSAGPVDPTE